MSESKPALNGLGRMEAFASVEEANAGMVEHAFEWEWFTQKYCAADYQLVHTVGEGMFVTIDYVGGNPDRDMFDVLRNSGLHFAAYDRIEFLYQEAKYCIEELLGRYDLSRDGFVDFSDPRSVIEVNALYHNSILAVNRFVGQTEDALKMLYGKDSGEARGWGEEKRTLLGESLSFGFCLEERNHIEHGMKPLAIIDLDPRNMQAGVGINLDSDYSHYDRRKPQGAYQKLRDGFVERRRAEGLRPFLSIAGMMETIQGCTLALYVHAIGTIGETYTHALAEARDLGARLGFNGLLLLRCGQVEKASYRPPRRVLRWLRGGEIDRFQSRLYYVMEACNSLKEPQCSGTGRRPVVSYLV